MSISSRPDSISSPWLLSLNTSNWKQTVQEGSTDRVEFCAFVCEFEVEDAPEMWREIRGREEGKIRPNSFTNRINRNRIETIELSNYKDIVSPHRGSINSLQVLFSLIDCPICFTAIYFWLCYSGWFDRESVLVIGCIGCICSYIWYSASHWVRSWWAHSKAQVLICCWQATWI